jgi:DNA modification methylase
MADWQVITGDCLEVMRGMDAGSVDAVITDPPYGLGFMGKEWDRGVPGVHFWQEALRVAKPGAHLLAFGGTRTFHRLVVAIEDAGWEIRDTVMWLYGSGKPKTHYSLKPAHEPIVMARKRLIGSLGQNVTRFRVGRLNTDDCRVPVNDNRPYPFPLPAGGRHPANVIHDGSDVVLDVFPQTAGRNPLGYKVNTKTAPGTLTSKNVYSGGMKESSTVGYADSGSAARYFYCAKASPADREDGNHHPTVKPTSLMRYLCRLVTTPGGVVLDPFAGSGSTGKAAMLEGFGFIGIELNKEYADIARARIAKAAEQARQLELPIE